VLKEEPLPPSTLNVNLPPAIDAEMRKALAKRPDDLYASAADFAQALRMAIRVTAPVRHDPDATMPNLAAPAAPAAATTSVPATTPPRAETSSAAAPAAAASIGAPVGGAPRTSQRAAIGIVAMIAVIGVVALAATWWLFPRAAPDPVHAKAAQAIVAAAPVATPATPAPVAATSAPVATPATAELVAATSRAPVATPTTAGLVAAAPPAPVTPGTQVALQPGKLLVTAVGLADPGNARYASDPSLLQTDVRADARSQLVAKTLMLMLDRESFATNYELLQSRVLSHSETFVGDVVQQSAAQVGKDGFMSMTTQAVVDVDAIRRALDRMTREDRVQLIRASGDPRIAVRIAVRDEDAPAATAAPSPVAENVLKERIASFGFRTWSEASGATGAADADFVVSGEASVRRLSTRLAASGLVITKYALASWTVKCTDKASGEEIYFNTTLPRAPGSYASEEAALRAIGAGVADAFSRDFFLTHVPVRGHKVALVVAGLSDDTAQALLARELQGLPGVIDARAGPPGNPRRQRNDRPRHPASAQREARRRMLQRRGNRGRARGGRPRCALCRRIAHPARDQSARRPLRCAAGAPQGDRHQSRNAAKTDGLAAHSRNDAQSTMRKPTLSATW
jgi:serine/threonine-protein kinase